jgi:protein-tyrosine phosphatase
VPAGDEGHCSRITGPPGSWAAPRACHHRRLTESSSPTILFLCTGNAARSVMAGAALAAYAPEIAVETAGTLTIEGQPASFRTRAGLEAVGLELPYHRSRQVRPDHLDNATVVIGLAPEHVQWVRREHPGASAHTGTLRRLARDLPTAGSLAQRVAALELDQVELGSWEEIEDPAGGEVPEFTACAQEIVQLVADLAGRLK